MTTTQDISTPKDFLLYLADNAMILGQRLSEWCGHGPVLEQDIALTNMALDQIGLARNLYQYLAEVDGGGSTEDTYPMQRDVLEWRNMLLVEQPNTDFAYTIVRQFLYDSWAVIYYEFLTNSSDERLAALAAKSLKEIKYHFKFSSEWMIRLGDGTDKSHAKMQMALDDLWMFSEEALSLASYEANIDALDGHVETIIDLVKKKRLDVIEEATLQAPNNTWFQTGGKLGRHSEHLGFILSDLQYYQKTYPNVIW